ncbi:MAG: aminomethyltransferase family protein [Acidobacteria bacterium]|nr:aminomethyltransferase family protein [Acidobacteriota bacterium]
MPIPTAVHERTFPLCTSLNYREWAGYYAPSSYETTPEHEYNAIRQAAALIDVTPLYKYWLSGRDATRLVNRIITRDIHKVVVGQVIYCCWCDEQGHVIDDGTITRLAENEYRWTAAEPNLRWFSQNAIGYDVAIRDISREVAALALQGPTSARLLKRVAQADISSLKYYRMARGSIAGVAVDISRTGYTGDLGYEIWVGWDDAVRVWDAIAEAGDEFDLHPAGMLALDIARIEAGLILLDVDYTSSRKALIASQRYSPYELGLGKLVDLKKTAFVGREALMEENRSGPRRKLVGLEIRWPDVERIFAEQDLPPQAPTVASRIAVPVYCGHSQAGRATSTTWSPTLKKMIALASIGSEHAEIGTKLEMEYTVEAVRQKVGATVVKTPFFNPARKTAVPA